MYCRRTLFSLHRRSRWLLGEQLWTIGDGDRLEVSEVALKRR